MTDSPIECDKLFETGSQKWLICTGQSKLSLEKTNRYREHWGLYPLESVEGVVERVVHDAQPAPRVRRSTQVKRAPKKKEDCGCSSPRPKHGAGTELKELLRAAGVPPCQDCDEAAARMNEWGIEGCAARRDEIVEEIMPRARSWVTANRPWVDTLLPGIVKDAGIRMKVGEYVDTAIATAREKDKRRQLEIAVNRPNRIGMRSYMPTMKEGKPILDIITAVRTSYREEPTLGRTVDSLTDAGFRKPLVFAEPNTEATVGDVRWEKQRGPFPSFIGMAEYLLGNFGETWFLLCEDDVEFQPGLAQTLRSARFGTHQLVSLYLSKSQERHAKQEWTAVEGDVWGSLAYLVHSSLLHKVLKTDTVRLWPYKDRVDKAVCLAVKEVDGAEMLFPQDPVCQHIGETSTLVSSRRLDARRTTRGFSEGPELPPVTVITCTGDRPEQFARCRSYMDAQTYKGQILWVIVDDGISETVPSDLASIRLEPDPSRHTLCRNIREAMKYVDTDMVLFMEDDDYYSPDYVACMVSALEGFELAGEVGAKYYWPEYDQWKYWGEHKHVSLCRTGVRGDRAKRAVLAAAETDHPSLDLRLWSSFQGLTQAWLTTDTAMSPCIGVKGGGGRQSKAYRPAGVPGGAVMFKQWTGVEL